MGQEAGYAYHTDSGLPGFRYSDSVASMWLVGKGGGQKKGKEIFVIFVHHLWKWNKQKPVTGCYTVGS